MKYVLAIVLSLVFAAPLAAECSGGVCRIRTREKKVTVAVHAVKEAQPLRRVVRWPGRLVKHRCR